MPAFRAGFSTYSFMTEEITVSLPDQNEGLFGKQLDAMVRQFCAQPLAEKFRFISFAPHEDYGPHAHQRIEINYVRRGSCAIECSGQTLQFREGELMIIRSRASHRFVAGQHGATLMQLEFQPDIFQALSVSGQDHDTVSEDEEGQEAIPDSPVLKVAVGSELVPVVRSIIVELQQRRPGYVHLVLLLYAQLQLLLRRYLSATDSGRVHHPALRAALAYVEQNCRADLCVAEIARHAGISERHLRSLFARVLHDSPIDYVRGLRVRHALQLLRSTDLSIKEVSYRCGFRSSQYFSRTFKRLYGYSPSAVQRSAESGSPAEDLRDECTS